MGRERFLIRCVILDLDGTVLESREGRSEIAAPIIAALNLMARRGIGWATNSGRDYEDQCRIVEQAVEQGLEHLPDAIMCNEVYIRPFRGQPLPAWEAWNAATKVFLSQFHPRIQRLLENHWEELQKRYQPLQVVREEGATTFLIADEGEKVARFVAELERLVQCDPEAVVLRNGGWVAVLPRGLGKGVVMGTYMRSRYLEADEVLAIGDQLNDISMLDGRTAMAVACPADAAEEVKEVVRQAGGLVSQQPGYRGVLDALAYFCGVELEKIPAA